MKILSRTGRILAATLGTALGVLALESGARAQISTGSETSLRVTRTHSTGGLQLPAAETFLGLSPYTTTFQFTLPRRDTTTGQTFIDKRTKTGPTILAEKLFFLRPNHGTQFSSATMGAWYFYNQNSDSDRFALYGKYFYDSRVGVQLSAGGNRRDGFFEYYSFLLYNVKNRSLHSPVGVQVGIGPYLPRRSEGDSGYTGLLSASYAPNENGRVSYSGSVWYVNYKQPASQFGFTAKNSFIRLYAGINYRL